MTEFLSAKILDISEENRCALVRVMEGLQSGKLVHHPRIMSSFELKHVEGNNFNMAHWRVNGECGSVCCIGGWAQQMGGPGIRSGMTGNLYELFHPSHDSDWNKITPKQAAKAIQNYLTTGRANWTEACRD